MSALLLPLAVSTFAVLWRRGSDLRPAALGGLAVFAIAAKSDEVEGDRHTIGISGSAGRYETSCSGIRQFGNGGVEYSYMTEVKDTVDMGFSVSAAAGIDEETNGSDTYTTFVVRPRYNFEHRFVGFSVGAMVGATTFDGVPFVTSADGDFGAPLLPVFRIRGGPRDLVWGELNFFDHDPSSFPKPFVTGAVGFALPKTRNRFEHSHMRVGVGGSGLLWGTSLAMKGGWMLDGEIHWWSTDVNQATFGVRRHFGRGG